MKSKSGRRKASTPPVTSPDRNANRTATPGIAATVLLVFLLALFGYGQQEQVEAEAAKAAAGAIAQVQPAQKATGIVALERAAAAGKYLFILFYRDNDDSTKAMKKVVASAAAEHASKANSVTISLTDAAEREIVAKYHVEGAPMPLTFVVAPTGAITGGFPRSVTKEQLSSAFVSPGVAVCLKALQDNKLVLLCVQNASTKSNDAALKGVQAFKADARYAQFTEVVSLDPADAAEAKFLAQIKVDPKTGEAVTAFMAPPGAVIARYNGATDKDVMIAALTAATSGGCGSGGCGPSGCGPTK